MTLNIDDQINLNAESRIGWSEIDLVFDFLMINFIA